MAFGHRKIESQHGSAVHYQSQKKNPLLICSRNIVSLSGRCRHSQLKNLFLKMKALAESSRGCLSIFRCSFRKKLHFIVLSAVAIKNRPAALHERKKPSIFPCGSMRIQLSLWACQHCLPTFSLGLHCSGTRTRERRDTDNVKHEITGEKENVCVALWTPVFSNYDKNCVLCGFFLKKVTNLYCLHSN